MSEEYAVFDKDTGEQIAENFATKAEAEIWCEENGIDYDYYDILVAFPKSNEEEKRSEHTKNSNVSE